MILLIDNYDSFSYNLYQLIGSFDTDIKVVRNDAVTVDEIRALNPSHIILSPGPGFPKDAGICEDVVKSLKGEYPIMGVCLGHQAICESFGARITHAVELVHGKQSIINIDVKSPVFNLLNPKEKVARYHSLIAERDTLPDCLQIIGEDDKGEIMAVKHRDYDIYGLQFHPESILTPCGNIIIKNFLSI